MHKKAARRLVHIENAYATSKARQERYKEDGEEKYQYFATLDLKTSVVCRKLDKKVFDTEDYAVGTTAPPMHPHCRSTTVAYYGMEPDTRMARNPVTGKSEKVDNMSYQEWYDKYVKGNPEAEAREKMWQNRYLDDKQYQRYKAVLGKKAPKTLEEFQQMKYIDTERWDLFQAYTRSVKAGELTPLADFKLYEKASKEIDQKLIGMTAKNGIVVSDKSDHFIARTIGLVEQRRNGVEIERVREALTDKDTTVFPIAVRKSGKSQKFRNERIGIEVMLNPETGVLIQANQWTGGRKK